MLVALNGVLHVPEPAVRIELTSCRLTKAVPYHLATPACSSSGRKSPRTELNRLPADYESAALPTELHGRVLFLLSVKVARELAMGFEPATA